MDAAGQGDVHARSRLLERHRGRLRRMVAVRLDRRLAVRVDPSDVVQEALTEADRRLDRFLVDRPLPFYPWLRRLAFGRLRDLNRKHVRAGRRSVTRELILPDESAAALSKLLPDSRSGPSAGARQRERQSAVRAALLRLKPADREVLAVRYLEQLSTADAAAVLRISESAVKLRLLRALHRMRDLLDTGEDAP